PGPGTNNSAVGAANGGAIHTEGVNGQPDTLIVQNSTFVGNQAIGGNGGTGARGAVAVVGLASAAAWRPGGAGSGACSAWAGASAPAAPTAPAGRPPGGTPPP